MANPHRAHNADENQCVESDMKIHTDFQQNSLEWLLARAGVITASEFDQFLTSSFELREGAMVRSYMARKLAERWLGPLPGFQTLDMEFGQIKEESAIPFYELEYNRTIQKVAFITTDDGKVGCSPDGLIEADGGIECKCPTAPVHVKYLLAGKLPKEYAPQVYGSLHVTGRSWWEFMSYHPKLPPLVIRIERDADIDEKISEALDIFLQEFDAAWTRLCELNGGSPKRFSAAREKQENQFVSETPS